MKRFLPSVPQLLSLVTLALFFLVWVQGARHIFHERPLSGAYVAAEKPKVSWDSFIDGTYQQAVDQHLRQSHGFRPTAIRLYNQYVWSIFHQSTSSEVVLGRHSYLYEPYVVQEYYEGLMYRTTDNPEEFASRCNQEAQRLAKVQAILAEYGTHLFLFCMPSKERILPQYLPNNQGYNRPKAPTAIELYPSLFEQYSVHFINYCNYLEQQQLPYSAYPQMGTHWTTIAATYAFDSVLRYMRQNSSTAIPGVELGAPYWAETRSPDDDLAQLLNLLRSPHPRKEQYVDVQVDTLAFPQTGLIVIGDSYFWNISGAFPLEKLFRYSHFWYYNSTIYFDEAYQNTRDVDLVEQLLDADFVMLSYCSGQLYDFGVSSLQAAQRFTCQALVKLCYDPDRIQAEIDRLCSRIRADQSWFDRLQRRAEGEVRSVDELVLEDAQYLIYNTPEEFFPELAEEGVPVIRCSKLKALKK